MTVEDVREEEDVYTIASAENASGAVTPYRDVAHMAKKDMIAWSVKVGASVPTNDVDVDARSVVSRSVDRPKGSD